MSSGLHCRLLDINGVLVNPIHVFRMHIYIYTYMTIHMCMRLCIYAFVRARVYARVVVCMYSRMRICACISVCA